MLVKDIMTREVVTVRPDITLKELAKILKDNRIKGVPVIDKDDNLIGIITMTDLLKILRDINYWSNIEKVKPGIGIKEGLIKEKDSLVVEQKMAKGVKTVSEDDTIERVVDLMCTHNIHTIPVVKNNKLIGVIGVTDIVGASF